MPEATLPLIFGTAFVIGLSGAVMPGPLLALTLGEAARYGFWAGPLLVLGHGILELALVIAVVLGLSNFIESDLVLSSIGIVGGAVLVVLGLGTARRGWQRLPAPTVGSAGLERNRKLVLSGVFVSFSNPHWSLWWATIGMTYLLWSLKLGAIGVASFFSGHILADLGWYALVAFIIATGKKAVPDATYHWLLIFCGLALVGLGVYFLASGVEFLAD